MLASQLGVLNTLKLQLKCLRILDASCNSLSKIQGLSENRVSTAVTHESDGSEMHML